MSNVIDIIINVIIDNNVINLVHSKNLLLFDEERLWIQSFQVP